VRVTDGPVGVLNGSLSNTSLLTDKSLAAAAYQITLGTHTCFYCSHYCTWCLKNVQQTIYSALKSVDTLCASFFKIIPRIVLQKICNVVIYMRKTALLIITV